MSLTKSDLSAIQTLILASETRLTKRIDDLDETLSQQVAAGFEEVHEKFDQVYAEFGRVHEQIDKVDNHVGRVEAIVMAEVNRADEQSKVIKKMRKTLKAV